MLAIDIDKTPTYNTGPLTLRTAERLVTALTRKGVSFYVQSTPQHQMEVMVNAEISNLVNRLLVDIK